MKKILTEWKKYLNESSLSRHVRWMTAHDTAIITAFRDDPSDDSECADATEAGTTEDEKAEIQAARARWSAGKGATREIDKSVLKNIINRINKRRNHYLKAKLLSMGYGVTADDGSYMHYWKKPEAYETKEDVFFVVNLEDIPSSEFFDSVSALGQKFCQDSVMLIPKGYEGAYLYGTNNAEFPGYGNKAELGSATFGKEAEFMTKVRGRPMAFPTEGLDTYEKLPRLQRMAVRAIAKKVLTD